MVLNYARLALAGAPASHWRNSHAFINVSLALNGCTKVSDLTPLAGLPSLQVLDIRGCSGITSIPDSLRSKPHLDITAPEEQFL